MKVPFFDLARLYAEQKAELEAAVAKVLEAGIYLHGPAAAAFESELKEFLAAGREGFCRSCHSGTDALVLSLLASGVGPGDEVITVAHTAIPTITAISLVGAVPVFADIRPKAWVMDVEKVEALLGPKTRAIVPVHLYGNPVDMAALRDLLQKSEREDVSIIEDTAQALGASFQSRQVGTWGRFGAFSFYPTKNLGALGDGGAVYCSHEADALRLGMLRDYGRQTRDVSQYPKALNSRLDEIQASVLRLRLPRVKDWLRDKDRLIAAYREAFHGLPLAFQEKTPGSEPAWHLCVIALESETVRDRLRERLRERGIETLIHYPVPAHLQPGWIAAPPRSLPVSESLAKRILSLPCHPGLSPQELEYVVETVRQFFG